MPGDNVTVLHDGKSEIDRAHEYRDNAVRLLEQLVVVLNAAEADGLSVAFQIGGPNAFKRYEIARVEVIKKLL